jgi:hypothetical protein
MTLLQVGPENPGSISCNGRDFSLLHSSQTGFGTHPVSYPMGNGGSFPGGEARQLPRFIAEAKNAWRIARQNHVRVKSRYSVFEPRSEQRTSRNSISATASFGLHTVSSEGGFAT